jgi:hypothetical protein
MIREILASLCNADIFLFFSISICLLAGGKAYMISVVFSKVGLHSKLFETIFLFLRYCSDINCVLLETFNTGFSKENLAHVQMQRGHAVA